MPEKLQTVVAKIPTLKNQTNVVIVNEFYEFLKAGGSSERNQKNCLKAVLNFGQFLGGDTSFLMVNRKEQILDFLNSKEKSLAEDPDKRWITTYNSYLTRIRNFFRWLHNARGKKAEKSMSEWKTPAFAKIKEKRTKRLSPYSVTDIFDRDEFMAVIKYEPDLRNRAILAMAWDFDARPHEICLLRIKHIRLRERYGEGIVPAESKTGAGALLLTMSFPYVRDLLNAHPMKDSPNAPLIVSKRTGGHLTPDAIWKIFKDLRARIKRMLDNSEIADPDERAKLEFIIRTKKFSPYCIRHSAITADADFLPGYALNQKVRWSMGSRQSQRYIKARMGDQLKKTILAHNGVISPEEIKPKSPVIDCPRCNHLEARDTKYCSKCSYPLTDAALAEIKAEEDKKVQSLQEQLRLAKEESDQKFERILYLISQNPKLANIKPEALARLQVKEQADRE